MALRFRAVNTAPDSENKIHTDRVAAEYGFRGGLVPGVTIYAYMAAAAVEHFGPRWLGRGAMDLRLLKPVYHGDELIVTSEESANGHICIKVNNAASGDTWLHSEAPSTALERNAVQGRRAASRESLAPGIVLGPMEVRLNLHESRVTAPLDSWIGPERLAHPAVLLSLANEILMSNFELGPWMHTASEIRKRGIARDGDELRVHARIAEAFERKGHEFVVLDVQVFAADAIIEQVRHTAIWRPRKP